MGPGCHMHQPLNQSSTMVKGIQVWYVIKMWNRTTVLIWWGGGGGGGGLVATELCECISPSSADPFYWAWLPMARKPFSDRIKELVLDKLKDDSFVTSIVEDLRVLFAVC